MRNLIKSLCLVLSFLFCFSVGSGFADGALVAKGKELFNAKEGLNVKIACILCHKDSKALDPAKMQALGDGLPDVINKYIVEKAKGEAIANDSEEMKALVVYLQSGQS